MTDTETNRLCAELRGIAVKDFSSLRAKGVLVMANFPLVVWNPINNPAQAEEVEQALLDLGYSIDRVPSGMNFWYPQNNDYEDCDAITPDERRRALCEFAAKVQQEKTA